MKLLFILIFVLKVTNPKRHCTKEIRKLQFYKLKSCHRSTLPTSYLTYTDKVEICASYCQQKNGLAFNFSPPEAIDHKKGFTMTCQVLACPEIAKSSTLVEDVEFDYYSAYGNWTATENATCIKGIGLFSIFHQKQNYINSIDTCQQMGAEIADITTDTRTKYLSRIINDTLDGWYKVAYVGLDDLEHEGNFITSFDIFLTCIPFRSWAPGHPISDSDEHDCVVLDDNKFWRVVNCRRKFPVLCEFYPEKPQLDKFSSCTSITNIAKKQKCIKREKNMQDTIQNLTRTEQCIIWNSEDMQDDVVDVTETDIENYNQNKSQM